MASAVIIRGESELVADIRRRMTGRGASKQLAIDSGVCYSHLVNVRNGKSRVGPKLAEKLGYRPAWERILLDQAALEDHLLANKVEAELNRPSLLKERDE